MPRELNPDLFDLPQPVASRTKAESDSLGAIPPMAPSVSWTETNPAKGEEWRLLISQSELLKRKVKEQDAKLEMLAAKVQDLVGGIKVRFERLHGAQSRTDEHLKSLFQDASEKYAQLASRVNERRTSDSKIQEMIDRHAQLVQSYELRLNQLQKLVTEQEMQLISYKAELRDAQRELARLKKP